MEFVSGQEGYECQGVFRVLGVLDGDVSYYTRGDEDIDLDTVMVGSAPLAEHADRNGVQYRTETADIDLYAPIDQDDLEDLVKLPLAEERVEDRAQIEYDTTAASTAHKAPDAFVDIISDFEKAFGWESQEAREIETQLENDMEGSPVYEGAIDVYLPELTTLRDTYRFSGRDYSDRIELIDRMREDK